MGQTYEAAGVSIRAGEEAVARIKGLVSSTFRPGVIGEIGGFGGLYSFAKDRYRDPVLVSSTDGAGTKTLVAQATGRYRTIGIDLVAMCVDDIAAHGAEPLFFLDYLAMGRVDPERVEQLMEGVAAGCRAAECALIGGETAEHPGTMPPGGFDLAGFAVGVVERSRLITGARVEVGDVLVGLLSPGLRSNGYSLARRVLLEVARRPLDGPAFPGSSETLADELLRPSEIYSPAIQHLCRAVDVRALAHITGGGIPGNVVRVLPRHCDALIRRGTWQVPRIFDEIQRAGEVSDAEMSRVFNLGIGMVAVVARRDLFHALDALRSRGREAVEIGEMVPGEGRVVLD